MLDLLGREIPTVLRHEIYAVAGLAGALVVVHGNDWRMPPTAVAASFCLGLLLISIRRNWQLPVAGTVN